MVKRATSLFNSFCRNVARQIARFCCPFFRSFRSDNFFQVLFGPIFALSAKIETQLSSNYVRIVIYKSFTEIQLSKGKGFSIYIIRLYSFFGLRGT